MKPPVPSLTQVLALRRMATSNGIIQRIPGGFWISGNIVIKPNGSPESAPLQPLNEVWCDIQTVRAMERRGWIERLNELDEWRDPRRITDAGRAVIPPPEIPPAAAP